MDFLPEVFEVRQVFFGHGGVNKLSYQNGILFFEWIPDLEGENPRKTEIAPLKEEWLSFWNEMQDIDAWTWEKEFIPPPDVNMDGDIVDINISFKYMKIDTHCWCITPPQFKEFYYALYELTDLHFDVPGGI
jgi:hypothetical protein